MNTSNRKKTLTSALGLIVGLAVFGGFGTAAYAAPTEKALTKQWVRQLVGVGAGPGGYAVVSWVPGKDGVVALDVPNGMPSRSPVMVAVRPRGDGSFRAPRPISPRNAETASMAVSETGKTMVIWANSDAKIRARYRTPSSGWSKILHVAGYGATAFPEKLDLDIAEDGTAVVGWRSAWKRNAGAPMVAMFRPRRGFLKPRQVGPEINPDAPLAYAQGVFNAVSARRGGKGTAVWTSSCDGNRETMRSGWSVNLDIRRGADRPAKVRSAVCPHSDVSLSENARGKAVLAINGYGFGSIIRVAIRPAGKRRFRRAVRVTPKGLRASFADVMMHADGSATLVAPVTDNQGSAGLVGLDFFRPRTINFERDRIAPRASARQAVGANNRGDVAVLSQNVDARMWDYTSKPFDGSFAPSTQLPFQNFIGKPGMTLDPSAVAVGPNGKALAATARVHWNKVGTTGYKGIYVFEGLPRTSEQP